VLQADHFSLVGPLLWHEFDGEWVVFSTATSALRHLDTVTAAVLSILEETPTTAATLARQISHSTEVELSAEMMSGIVVLLEELQRGGLVECQKH
jgi:isoaspartyl peptidase/L-asparaginase-like protein (Ntn-hydrolase superfamily)